MTPPDHTPEDVTLGEIYRGLNALRDEMRGRLDNLSFVSRDVYAAEMQALREDVKELQDRNRWTARTLVASFLYPLLLAAAVALVIVR